MHSNCANRTCIFLLHGLEMQIPSKHSLLCSCWHGPHIGFWTFLFPAYSKTRLRGVRPKQSLTRRCPKPPRNLTLDVQHTADRQGPRGVILTAKWNIPAFWLRSENVKPFFCPLKRPIKQPPMEVQKTYYICDTVSIHDTKFGQLTQKGQTTICYGIYDKHAHFALWRQLATYSNSTI